jgi:NADH-quinone oxidoreductase subunit J
MMFLVFATITLVGALAMFRARNLVVAGLCLVLSFLGVAGLFLMLANPVAAGLQVIVYSGAIVVLVLFVIMMLSSHEEEPAVRRRPLQLWLGALLAAGLGAGACWLVSKSSVLRELGSTKPTDGPMTLQRLGVCLFQDHLLAFEVAGLMLLAAMVASILLVKREA